MRRITSRRWSTSASCYRQQAPLETDPVKQQQLVAEADRIRNEAIAIVKKKKAEAAAAAAGKKS